VIDARDELSTALMHADRMAQAIQNLVQWQDGITPDEFGLYMEQARVVVTDYLAWVAG